MDKWEFNYIKDLKDWDALAWTDEEAYEMYPDYNRVYDKLFIARRCSTLKTYDLEKVLPSKYPVIVKPKINLVGMSKGAYIASSIDEIGLTKGMMAQEIAKGNHYSMDLVFQDGEIIDWFAFQAHKNYYGSFTLFASTSICNEYVCTQIKSIMKGYTGVVCVEYIGHQIIDVHLRPSVQFFDICGGLQEQLPHFIKTGEWNVTKFEKTYSKVYRRFEDSHVVKFRNLRKPNAIRSVQECWERDKYLSENDNDMFSYRYMVINGTNLESIENYAFVIHEHLHFYTKKDDRK